MPAKIVSYEVELPAGGKLHLQSPDEVMLWNDAMRKYKADYTLQKHNDLVTLGSLVQQQIVIYRAQTAINGMEPVIDKQGVPTGSWRRVSYDAADLSLYQKTLVEAQKEMGRLEKQLGIDKTTREAGGAHTVDNYIKTLKRAAHDRGIHITKMVTEYQGAWKELSWRLRLLYHADAQDRAYHNVTPKTVLDWLVSEVARLEQIEKDFAKDRGKLYVGRL